MSATEAALSEIDEGIIWAKKHHVNGQYLKKEILEKILKRAEEKRASTRNPLGVQDAKRVAIAEVMSECPAHRHHSQTYSSVVSHIYGMRRSKKQSRQKLSAPESEPVDYSDKYAQIAARTEGYHRDDD